MRKLAGAFVRAKKGVFDAHPSKHFPKTLLDILLGFHTQHIPQRKMKVFGLKSLQALLAHSADSSKAKVALSELKDQGELEEVARIISQKDSGSFAVHLAVPTSSDLCLPRNAAIITEKVRAGLLKLSGAKCPCGQFNVELSHVLGCSKFRMNFVRHDVITNILLKSAVQAGQVARAEWLVEGDSSKRMDLLRFSGGVHWNDISVVNPVAPSYVRASQRIGGAIERRERDKKRKWDLVAARRGASFTPTVLEATGRRSELTKALFKELAVSAAEITEEDVSTGRRKDMFVSRVVGEITQHVSVAMAHCNALLIEEAEHLAQYKERPRKLARRAWVHASPKYDLF